MSKSEWKDRPGVPAEECGCQAQITKANDKPIRDRIKPCHKHWRQVAEAECARSGHIPVPINDCDDWPGINAPGDSCACRLVGTAARACTRCRKLVPAAQPAQKQGEDR